MHLSTVARLLSTISAVTLYQAAIAQTVPDGAPTASEGSAQAAPHAASADAATVEQADVGEIVVTGSRISRAGFSAPTPVTVISTDTLARKAPASIADGLNQLPVFQNSTSAQNTAFTASNRVRTGNYLNLRSLGQARVLTLFDGERLVPTGNAGGTDANLIPQQLVERVDVVTGGASAAYGSDAVSGVVNFVLNKNYTGLKAFAQRGVSTYGDDGNYRIGAAAGASLLDDRLHVIGSVEYFQSYGMLRSDRPKINRLIIRTGTGTAANPFNFAEDTRLNTSSFTGLPFYNGGPNNNKQVTIAGVPQQFASDGSLVAFNPGIPTGVANLSIGGDGTIIKPSCCYLVPPSKIQQYFGRAGYDFTDNFHGYVQLSYNRSATDDRQIPNRNNNISVIYPENAYLNLTPVQRTALFGSSPSVKLGKTWDPADVPGDESGETARGLTITAGLYGAFADGRFKWNANYIHGKSNYRSFVEENETARLFAATDAVRDASNNIVCRVAITNPGLYPGCVPLNMFGTGNTTAAALGYMKTISWFRDVNRMDLGNVNVSGDIFNTWAGPVSIAIGAEIRKQSFDQTSNSDPAVPVDFTGIRGIPTTTVNGVTRPTVFKYISTNVAAASGDYTVKEIYGELDVPLLKDSPVGQSLDLNAAGRHTHYSTSGSVNTWKVGLTYQPISDIRFRGTISRDIRAPTLFELNAGALTQLQTITDYLTNRTLQVYQITTGNKNLTPEIAKTLTGGVVLTPSFIPGLSFSADYFRIRIRNAIGIPYGVAQVNDICRQNPANVLCANFTRAPDNTPISVATPIINAASFKSEGIDFEAAYRRQVLGGDLSLRALATRLLSFERRLAPDQPNIEFAGTNDFVFEQYNLPQPKWRATFEQTFTSGGTTISFQERMIGSYARSKQFVYAQNKVDAVWYVDLNLTQGLTTAAGHKFELYGTINNLFNKQGPTWSNSQQPGLSYPTNRNTYDIVGRYFTVGVRAAL